MWESGSNVKIRNQLNCEKGSRSAIEKVSKWIPTLLWNLRILCGPERRRNANANFECTTINIRKSVAASPPWERSSNCFAPEDGRELLYGAFKANTSTGHEQFRKTDTERSSVRVRGFAIWILSSTYLESQLRYDEQRHFNIHFEILQSNKKLHPSFNFFRCRFNCCPRCINRNVMTQSSLLLSVLLSRKR
jgi:hypothetical protein